MKKYLVNLLALSLIATASVSCKKNDKTATSAVEEVPVVMESVTYKAVPAKTTINWGADKLVGGHQGTINASNGILEVKGDALVGGSFIFDVNTIASSDLPAGENYDKLIGHLKSADFFDVATYPNAAFEITGVTQNAGKSIISGNLSIKDVKKNIEFPATVSVAGGNVTITSDEFTLDRTEWNIKYNSGKFADAAKLGDYLIKDIVKLTVSVTATK